MRPLLGIAALVAATEWGLGRRAEAVAFLAAAAAFLAVLRVFAP